ncbi:MAG: hypothetical protein ACKO3K_15920 [Cuspidothrix sp.]
MNTEKKFQSSADGQAKLKKAYKDAGFTIESLAATISLNPDKTSTYQDYIKCLLGTKKYQNGVDKHIVEDICKAINEKFKTLNIPNQIQPSDIVDNWYPDTITAEFKTIIEDKTQIFCGRKFVFNADGMTKIVKMQTE